MYDYGYSYGYGLIGGNTYNPLINYDWSTTTTSGLRYLKDVGSTPTYNASMYFGRGAYFNGVDQGIYAGTANLTTDSYSIVITTVNRYSSWYSTAIQADNGASVLGFTNTQQARFRVLSTEIISSSSIPINTPTTLIGVVTNNIGKLYVNGILDSSAIAVSSASWNNLYIGQRSGNTDYYKGTCKDMFIFSRALTQAEITQAYEQPELFYAMAQADSTCVLNMPMCETDGYVRNMKSYSEGNELLSDITLDSNEVSLYQTTYLKDTTTKLSGTSSHKFILQTGTAIFCKVATNVTYEVGGYYYISFYVKVSSSLATSVAHCFANITNKTELKASGAPIDGWQKYEGIVLISNISEPYYLFAYGYSTVTGGAVWIDGEATIKKVTGAYPITNYTTSVRDNAKNLQYGLQTCKFVRDSLGVIQSASNYLECDEVGYGNTGWIPNANKDFTIEVVRYCPSDASVDGDGNGREGNTGLNIVQTRNTLYPSIGTRVSGDLDSLSGITTNVFHHITVSYNSTTKQVSFYLDGISRRVFVTNFETSTYQYLIGKSQYGYLSKSQRRIFKVHNKVLTQEEVTKNYNSYVAKGLLS